MKSGEGKKKVPPPPSWFQSAELLMLSLLESRFMGRAGMLDERLSGTCRSMVPVAGLEDASVGGAAGFSASDTF